jgi:surface antigen
MTAKTSIRRRRVVAAAVAAAAALGIGGPALATAAPAITSVAPAAEVVAIGETTDHNLGIEGQCTWGAYEKFHEATGLWPVFEGNAADWNDTAPTHGWGVVLDAVPNSVVVFEPGIAGADATFGHVAWVTGVQDTPSGRIVTFIEMNGVAGPGQYNERTVVDQIGMSYIPAPVG